MAKGQSLQDPFLLRNSVSQMVYKHAISTIVPARNVRLPAGDDDLPPLEDAPAG